MSSKIIHFSSITKKLVVATFGAFLVLFLPVHLGINLLLLPFVEHGKELFQEAVLFMTTFPLVKIMEVVLFAAFILHMTFAILLQLQNWKSRPIRYKRTGTSELSPFSRFMIHTGVIMGLFILLHFYNFYFVKLGLVAVPEGAANSHDFYTMAHLLFSNPFYAGLYAISFLALGLHLHHAVQSMFQTFGLAHTKYSPVIGWLSTLYAIMISLGFLSIPIILYFSQL